MSAGQLVFSCAACRKVRDERWNGSDRQEWCTLAEWLRRHQASSDDVRLSECYCPDCALSYDRLMEYGQAPNTVV